MDEQFFVDGVLGEEPSELPRIEPNSYRESLDVETLVEQICDELGASVEYGVVDQVVQDMVSRYRHARIKSFVPIFVKRDAMDLLRRS